jgi:hypothetical protein
MSTDEFSRLLPPTTSTRSRDTSPTRSMSSSSGHLQVPRSSLWPLLLLLTITHMGHALYSLPLNRVIERRLCDEHYAKYGQSVTGLDGSIPEKMCKIDEVQRQLAMLQGIMETTLVVCDFVVAIPFSFIAERFGINVVLWCNLVPRIFMSVWALIVGEYYTSRSYFDLLLTLQATAVTSFQLKRSLLVLS